MGRTDVLYSDGGMFDNLPFFPALFVLRETQIDVAKTSLGVHDWYDSLSDRHRKPDLILAGSLDANPSSQEKEFEDLIQVCKRASSLQNNVKIQGFIRAAQKIDRQIHDLLRVYEKEVLNFPLQMEECLSDAGFLTQRPEVRNFLAASPDFSRRLR